MERRNFILSISHSRYSMDNLIAKLYQSPKTIFTIKDLALIWEETDPVHLTAKAKYYAKQGVLRRLTRGVFAKEQQYNLKELATSIYTPSYISFETVLREAGIIFQHYATIFVAAPWSFTKIIDGRTLTFRKLKKDVLFNPTGVKNESTYSIATPERAFLDMLYLFPNYYFDNFKSLKWNSCFELAEIYYNKELLKRLKKYHKTHHVE